MNVWSSLLLALTGGALTITGTVTGLRLQARHAAKARTEQYEREDRYRLFDKRQNAYVELYLKIGSARRQLVIYSRNANAADVLTDARTARNEYWAAYAVARLIGSEEVFSIADEILSFFDDSIQQGRFNHEQFVTLLQGFTDAARKELGAVSV